MVEIQFELSYCMYSTETLVFCTAAGTLQCHFLAFSHIQIWRTQASLRMLGFMIPIFFSVFFSWGVLLVADLFCQKKTLLLSLGQQ